MQTEEPKLPVGEYGRDQVYINEIGKYVGQTVRVYGWVYNKRSSGKLVFLLVRDGTGIIQCVVSKRDVGDELFTTADRLTQESSLMVEGGVRADARAPGGYELLVSNLKVYQEAEEYPITPKEHGTEFLMEHRHLWLRSSRQQAILKIRSEIISAVRDYLDDHGFTLLDNPILTPTAAEGTTNLFKTDYFDQPAFLSQSGQLYNEANALAFGKVYCFGPTFRAEKSKTRRHLIEFWMVEPEMAYFTQEENMRVQEELVGYVVQQVLKNRPHELEVIERDTSQLEKIMPPFPRITYDEAIKLLQEKGHDIQWGNDFGAPDETVISENYEKPVFVTHFPAKAKAFYMEPDPERPEVVLCADLLAPEGYGEIIGGSQRIADLDLLLQRIREHHLPEEIYKWYLDLRRYGSVPHSGFGMGIERVVAWVCKLPHVRETIPFPRLYDRIEM